MGGGGDARAPQNHPQAIPLMRRKKISQSVVYVLHNTGNLAFSSPGRAVMSKKMYKKMRDARVELLLCLFISTYCLFDVLFVVAVAVAVKVPNDDSFMLSLLVNY